MADLWLPEPTGDPLTRSPRVESWWVDLLTSDDASVGRLDGVTALSLDHKAGATIHGGGTLELDDVGQDIDWLTMRVQPWFRVDGYGEWPLGVYLLGSPRARVVDGLTTWRVDLYDKIAILDQGGTAESYSLPAGTVVTDAARQIIEDAGETTVALTDSEETLPTGMVWEAGTTPLRIVNDLLAAINYWGVRCDRWGRYVLAPYSRPQDRSPVRGFVPAADSILVPDWTVDQDLVTVPNRAVVVSRGSADDEAFVGVAENTDPGSPFSYPSRGRWITVVEHDVEVTSQGAVDARAARLLAERSSVAAEYEIAHAIVPLDLHDVVTLVDGPASVQRWAVRLTAGAPGALMLTTLRGVTA